MSVWKRWQALKGGGRERHSLLVEVSPLRRLDPRAKLAISLSISIAVMLPVERLGILLIGYFLLLAWAKLLPAALRQLWRMRWVLLFLFILDWWIIDLSLAILISLRLALLAGTFSLLVATTSFSEFRLAMERLGIPYPVAFSLGLAFQSLSLVEEEWQAIRESQQARGILLTGANWRETVRQIGSWVALTIPAVVLTTRRAWAATEAAHARGFDSPKRRPYLQARLSWTDWAVILISVILPFVVYLR